MGQNDAGTYLLCAVDRYEGVQIKESSLEEPIYRKMGLGISSEVLEILNAPDWVHALPQPGEAGRLVLRDQ